MKQLLLLPLLLTIVATTGAQPSGGTEPSGGTGPSPTARPFFDAVPFAGGSPDSARLDIYLVVPYGAVSFERLNGVYIGRYQARIRVERNGGGSAYDSSFVRTLRTPSYDATVGRAPGYEFFQQRVGLPAGEYTARVDLVDLRTSRAASLTLTVTAPGNSDAPFAMSGLLLVKKIREEAGGYVITPMISEGVTPDEDGYFLFFEAYNSTGGASFRINATYKDAEGNSIGEPMAFDRTIPEGRSQQWVRMPTTAMPRGTFTVTLRAAASGDTARTLARAERAVRLEEGRGMASLGEEELRERIAQLRYVAAQSDIDQIRDGATLAERQRRYGEFWEKLDPIPETAVNEAMEEYFHRVDYAESHYRSYAAGWLTDKGRVYIIFGPPDNSSTDPFRNDGRSVEVWQYYRRNLRLTFVDETGFGDFRLGTPLSPGEKFRYEGP